METRNDLMNRWRRSSPRQRRIVGAAAVAVGLWLLLVVGTGSATTATFVTVCLAAVATTIVIAARAAGINAIENRAVRAVSGRTWRDPRKTFELALANAAESFVVGPAGTVYGHRQIELALHPDTFGRLEQAIDVNVLVALASDAYADAARTAPATLIGNGEIRVQVLSDPTVGPGRWVYRRAPWPRGTSSGLDGNHDGLTIRASARDVTDAADVPARNWASGPHTGTHPTTPPSTPATSEASQATPSRLSESTTYEKTIIEQASTPPVPALTLSSGATPVRITASPATVGRAADSDVVLADVETVSRLHGVLLFDGRNWWIEPRGRNGVTLNDSRLQTAHVLRDGDTIRWGGSSSAPYSHVAIQVNKSAVGQL